MSKKEPHVRIYDELILNQGKFNGKHDLGHIYDISQEMVKDKHHPWFRWVSEKLFKEIHGQ